MTYTGYSIPLPPQNADPIWASGASGGRLTVDDPYELRELLRRLAVQVELPQDSAQNLDHYSAHGEFKFHITLADDPSYTHELVAPFHSWYNSNLNGSISDLVINTPLNSWNLFGRLGDIYNSYFNADGQASPEKSISLAVDIYNFYSSAFSGSRSTQVNDSDRSIENADVVFDLSPQFWSGLRTLKELDPATLSENSFDFSYISPLLQGGTINLGSLATQYTDYSTFSTELTNLFDVSVQSNVPLPLIEFAPHLWSELTFRHEQSGLGFSIRANDNDSSDWAEGSSGLNFVETIYDLNGNPVSTEIEYGIGNPLASWQTSEFLRLAEQAFAADLASHNGPTPFDGRSKWVLEGGSLWSDSGPAMGLGLVGNHIIGPQFDELLASSDLSFYTVPLSSALLPSTQALPVLSISDYSSPVLDLSELSAGFDVALEPGNTEGILTSLPYTRYFNIGLQFTPNFSPNPSYPNLQADVGGFNVDFRSELDGAAYNDFRIYRHNSIDLAGLYPSLAEADPILDFRLERVNVDASLFDSGTSNTWGNIEFRIQPDGSITTHNYSPSSFLNGATLSQFIPDWELLRNISVSGLFEPTTVVPSSISAVILPENYTNNQAIGFNYSLRAVDSETPLSQLAVLGQSVDHSQHYYLDIYASSLLQGQNINTLDFTVHLDTDLFGWLGESHITLGSSLPVVNSVYIDRSNESIRIAAASLDEMGLGNAISYGEDSLVASIRLNFNEPYLQLMQKNPDGSLISNPFTVAITANEDETILSRQFVDEQGLINSDIYSLASLGGHATVSGQEVTLYEAFINLEQLGNGLVLGTQRIIGSDAGFTNLIRQGDTVNATVEWLNVGNIRAENLVVHQQNNPNAHLVLADTYFSSTSVDSGRFVNGQYMSDDRESTVLNAAVKVTGNAGNVVDISDGLFAVQAYGSDSFYNNGLGSSNLITYQGDLNYDGRVSMKDLAYLNAGAARQVFTSPSDYQLDLDSNGVIDSTVARDVDANFDGRIDLADLSILDMDWGKTLHHGDREFQGSSDISWQALDTQGPGIDWDNSAFKAQNTIESSPHYIGSLESPGINIVGADGNYQANDADSLGTFYQDLV